MAKVFKYKVYCNTDAKWEYIWRHEDDGDPTVCPANDTHTIDSSSIAIVGEVNSQAIETSSKVGSGGPQLNPRGFNFTALKNTTTTFDYKITDPLTLKGVRVECENNVLQDNIDFAIVDVDNILGLGAGYVVETYGKNWPVSKTGIDLLVHDRTTETPLNGLYIRFTYRSVGTTDDVKGTVGLIMFE